MNGINQYKIVLRPDEVQEFVNEASRYDFDIDIAYNSYVVDAKSILGVYGLDLTRVLIGILPWVRIKNLKTTSENLQWPVNCLSKA